MLEQHNNVCVGRTRRRGLPEKMRLSCCLLTPHRVTSKWRCRVTQRSVWEDKRWFEDHPNEWSWEISFL